MISIPLGGGGARLRGAWGRLLVGLIAAGIVVCASPGRALARGFIPVSSTEAALGDALGPRRIALVVGIDAYDDPAFGALRHAEADALAVADAFTDPAGGAFTEVVRLTRPDETTRGGLLAELRRLGRDLSPADTFVFYFSGHGTLEPGPDGAPVYYLVASDTRQGELADTGIELGGLLTFLAGLALRRRRR